MDATGPAARRAREKKERREAILDAAEVVFGAKGAANATMEDVAEAAEVSKGTVYLYFKSKDDLFLALTHRPLEAVLARFAALAQEELVDGRTLLSRLIRAHAEVVYAHAPHFRLAMASMCGGFSPDPSTPSLGVYAQRVRTLRGTYVGAIERGIADGSLRSDLPPNDVAAALWAAMFGATFLRMNAPRMQASLPEEERLDFDRIVPTLAGLLIQSLENPDRKEDAT